jgi:YVTN family beta-propeller protein
MKSPFAPASFQNFRSLLYKRLSSLRSAGAGGSNKSDQTQTGSSALRRRTPHSALSTRNILALFVVATVLASAFVWERARAAAGGSYWPGSLTNIFASRSARALSPPAPVKTSGLTRTTRTSITSALSSSIGDVAVDVGNNTLYKLKAADGTIIWGPVSRGNCGGLAVDQVDFGVYTGGAANCTGGGSGAVYKYDASGASVWSTSYSGCGVSGNYYVGNGGIAVDTTSGTPGVVLAKSGYYGDLGKVSRTNGSTLFCDPTNDLGRPTIDPVNGQIYAITNAGPGLHYNTLYSAAAAGSLTSTGSCEGYTDLNPADGMLYRGGGGCGLTLYQMNKTSLGGTNWSMSLSGSIASFEALAVQPWSGGYVYVASVSSSKIVVVDPATQSVVRTFTTAITPNNIAVNPSGGNLYITNGASNFVYGYSPTGSLVWISPDLGGPAFSIAAPKEIVGTPTAANGVISGRIVSDTGTPVEGAVINLNGDQSRKTVTDPNGNYQFDDVETNGFYTVTPARVNYTFNPFNRSFSQLGNKTEATFTGTSTGDNANPLDMPEYFVRQQYVDLLGREPEEDGFNYWSDRILECGGDGLCVNARRRDVAAAFFIEAEFQQTGSFIYGLYKASLGRTPAYAEFSSDRQHVIGGSSLETMKQAFAESFIGRAEFVAKYQANTTAESFVNALLVNVQQASGIDLSSQRDILTATYNTSANLNESRSLVVRELTESADFRQAEYNAAFVLTEYFGYLRRDAEPEGYNFWLDVLNNREPENFRGMVCAFITSTEYQQRFSAIVSHSNQECGK